MSKIGELITKLEDEGIEIKRVEWLEDGHLHIECSPPEKAVNVASKLGYEMELGNH